MSVPFVCYSDMCVRYEGGIKHYYNCPEPEKKHRVTWKTTTTRRNSDGVILKKRIEPDTICYNYPEGSFDYRDCKREAQKLFRDKCKEMRDKVSKHTNSPSYEQYKLDKEMYCLAQSQVF